MTTRKKNMLQVSRYVPQTEGRTTQNQPNSDPQSRSTRRQQLPSQLTVFDATYPRSSTSLSKPQPRSSTSLSELSKPQPHTSNSFSDSRKAQSRTPTSFTIQSKVHGRPSTALAASDKLQVRSSLSRHSRQQSPAQSASNDGRSRKDYRSNEQEPEDIVSQGIVNTDLVSPAVFEDRLLKTAHKQIRTSEMQKKSAKTSQRKNILKMLNLEDYPSYWYTTVVPATDVYVHRHVNHDRASFSGLRVKSKLDTSQSRQISRERDFASASNTVSGSHAARPSTSRLICHISPVTTTQQHPADLSGIARRGQYDILYETALRRQKETCRNKEEMLRRKVQDFLASLDKTVKSKSLFSL